MDYGMMAYAMPTRLKTPMATDLRAHAFRLADECLWDAGLTTNMFRLGLQQQLAAS